MLDVKITSALNKIIQNSQLKKKVSLKEQNAQTEVRFQQGRQNRAHDLRLLSSYWCSWHNTTLHFFFLCSSPWWQHSEIRHEMWRSSFVDVKNSIRWNLGRIVKIKNVRVWETQDRIGPDYQRFKTMVKRSIEQNLRIKNFKARNGNYEKKRRGQESGEKTACTKNSWILLALESQRAVFWRRQL